MNGNQDWDQVVIRKKAPTSSAAKAPSAVNAAIRAGGCWALLGTRGCRAALAALHTFCLPLSFATLLFPPS